MGFYLGERPFPCLYCAYSAKDRSTLRAHMETHPQAALHGMSLITLPPAEIAFSHVSEADMLPQEHPVHVEEDSNEMFGCESCSGIFRSRRALVVHMRMHRIPHEHGHADMQPNLA